MPKLPNYETDHSPGFGFPDEPLDDSDFTDLSIDNGGFDDDGNWEEGTGKPIETSNVSTNPYEELNRKFGDEAIQRFIQFAIDGRTPADFTDSDEGLQYGEYLALADDVSLQRIETLRSIREIHETIKANVLQSAPLLLEGKLSPGQEEALGSTRYALGINQSGFSVNTIKDAQDYLDDNQGIPVGHYSLDQRFILFDERNQGEIEKAVVDGYYGHPKIGKFVIAIPIEGTSSDIVGSSEAIADFRQRQNGDNSVNPKYTAGFIDDEGNYHENKNFGVSNEPLFDDERVKYNHPEVFQDLDITPIEDSDSVTYEIPGIGVISLLRLDDYGGKRVLQVDIAEINEDKQGLGLGTDMYRYVANHLPEGYQGILSGTITHEAIHHIYETLGKDPKFLLHRIGHGIKPSMYLLETIKPDS